MNVLQYTFDVACHHLMRQFERSKHGECCSYRGEAGRMCAVGPFIHTEQDCTGGVETLFRLNPELREWYDREQESLFSALQDIHDPPRLDGAHSWHRRLIRLAESRDLSTRVLNDSARKHGRL